MIEIMHLQVDEFDTKYGVNGVEIEKEHLKAVFGNDDENALTEYLVTVPFFYAREEHFRKHHKLSEAAKHLLARAVAIVDVLNINDRNLAPFLLTMMAKANTAPDEISKKIKVAFGSCDSALHDLGKDREFPAPANHSHTVH